MFIIIILFLLIISTILLVINFIKKKDKFQDTKYIKYKGLNLLFPNEKVLKNSNNQVWLNWTGLTTNRPSIIFKEIDSIISINPDMNILDFGCGMGEIAIEFYLKYNNFIKYTGIEIDEKLIKLNKINMPKYSFFNTNNFLITKEYDMIMFMGYGHSMHKYINLAINNNIRYLILESHLGKNNNLIEYNNIIKDKYNIIYDKILNCGDDSTLKRRMIIYEIKDQYININKCFTHTLTKSQKEKYYELINRWNLLSNKLNINWIVCGGSYIGAIRHNDFIPWDDDFDITIMKKDKFKLEKLFNNNTILSKYGLSISNWNRGYKIFLNKDSLSNFSINGFEYGWPFIDIFTEDYNKCPDCFYLDKDELLIEKVKFGKTFVNVTKNALPKRKIYNSTNWKKKLIDTGYRHSIEKQLNLKCKEKKLN